MHIEHSDVVRQVLGQKRIGALSDIFKHCTGSPPSVPASRYRADHPSLIDVVDELEGDRLFLQRDNTAQNYRLRIYALPLIDEPPARALLELMEPIFEQLKSLYHEYLSDPIPLSRVIENIKADRKDVLDALFYLTDAHGVWSGLSNDFPYGINPTIGISESVIRRVTFGSIIGEFYRWHFVNPKKSANAWENDLPDVYADGYAGFLRSASGTSLPPWYQQLDDAKRALIIEIDKAVAQSLQALPTMGLRTLVESVMRDRIGEKRSFNDSLTALRKAGLVTDQHAQLIEHVIDVGHASAHRAHFPDPAELGVCIDVVKHLIEGIYVLTPKMDAVAKSTPERSPPDNNDKT